MGTSCTTRPSSRTTHPPAGALPAVRGTVRRSRPPCLGEPRGPQERVQPHITEPFADVVPGSGSGLPCGAGGGSEEGDQLVAVLNAFDFPVPEQVVKVPKLSFRRGCMWNLRILPIDHQTAEQLVEVPIVVSFSSLQWTAEQSTDIPGTGRRQRRRRSGHSSTASVGEQIADIPVPRGRGGLGGGSLQGFSPGQGSTAFRSDYVDFPVPRGGGLQGFRPGPGFSRASSSSSRTAEGAFDGFFRTSPGVKKSAGSASQCGDHPPGNFSLGGVLAHSSSWSPATCGHGTLPVDDDGHGGLLPGRRRGG